ncbi:hypothetical protein D3C76_570580 [compost metagenome]
MRFDFFEFPECPVDVQRVQLVGGHAIGQQGDFQGRARQVAQRAFAGILVGVPEVGPGLRRSGLVKSIGAVGQYGGIADVADAVVVLERCRQLRGIGDQREVELLEQSFFFATDAVAGREVDHVPTDIAALYLGLDDGVGLGRAVLLEDQAELLGGRFQDRLALCFLVGATLGDKGDRVFSLGQRCAADQQGKGGKVQGA